jgi:release factor glutamine methyltransferase
MTVAEALAEAQRAGVARLDAQWLLGHQLQRGRAWLLAHDDAELPSEVSAAWPFWLQRRLAGEPLAYLTGEREFCGLRLAVSADVLVPRPETEGLVHWALEVAPDGGPVLDLGCGSGAIALALKAARPALEVHASDISAAALAVAGRNAQSLGLPISLHAGPWWQAPPAGHRFGLVMANPPYVAPADPHLAALTHEPLLALVPAGDRGDGMTDLRRIIDGASARLLPGAWLLLEHGHDQGAAVREALARAGLQAVETRRDMAGLERFSGGCRILAPHLPDTFTGKP